MRIHRWTWPLSLRTSRVTALGMRFRCGQQNATDYFLGGAPRHVGAGLFDRATETPRLRSLARRPFLRGNLTFLQLVFATCLAGAHRAVVAPGYFRGEFLTAYALIEKRFGQKMRAVAASTFLVTRAIAEGVRVSAIALVVSVVMNLDEASFRIVHYDADTRAIAETRTPSAMARVTRKVLAATARIFWPNRFSISA